MDTMKINIQWISFLFLVNCCIMSVSKSSKRIVLQTVSDWLEIFPEDENKVIQKKDARVEALYKEQKVEKREELKKVTPNIFVQIGSFLKDIFGDEPTDFPQ